MLAERRTLREQTPKRDLNKEEYQPRRLVPQNKIELGLPKTSWTPHKDTALHEIYPIPKDGGERRSSQQQPSTSNKENAHRKERVSETNRNLNPPSGRDNCTGGSAGAPGGGGGGGGGGDDPSDPSGDEGPNREEEADSEEENGSSITSARLRGQRGQPGPTGP